jgi:hypothetical protein
MITFEDLVHQTYAVALEKHKKNLPLTQISNVLTDAGLKALLADRFDDGIKAGATIMIRKVNISGVKWPADEQKAFPFSYQREFGIGINAWVAENSSGKSTILKMILWAITGVQPKLKKDVLLWIKSVAVEFEIDDGIFTIQYSPRVQSDPSVAGEIYRAGIDIVLSERNKDLERIDSFSGSAAMKESVTKFFSRYTNFHPLQLAQKSKNMFELDAKNIDWSIYSQALFIGADDYSDFLFPWGDFSPKHRQRAIWMYMGLDFIDIVSHLQLRADEAKNHFEFEKKRVTVNAEGVLEKIRRLEDDLMNTNHQIENIESEKSIFVDQTAFENLRKLVSDTDSEVIRLSYGEQDLISRESQIQNEINSIKRYMQEIKEAIEFRVFLSGIQVDRCPHCENTISLTRIEEEVSSGQCRICSNTLKPLSNITSQQELLKDYEDKLQREQKQLRSLRKEIKSVHAQISDLQIHLAKYKAEFTDISRQERDGFSHELRNLLLKRGKYEGELSYLQQQTRESQSDYLEGIKLKFLILSEATKLMQANLGVNHEQLLRTLDDLVTNYAKRFGVQNLQRVFLKEQLNLFAVQSETTTRFEDMDIGERLRIKIAFHLAMLTIKVQHEIGKHPCLLMVDAPGSAEMTDKYLDAILVGFKDMETLFGGKVQVFLASTREEIAQICDQDKLEMTDGPLF